MTDSEDDLFGAALRALAQAPAGVLPTALVQGRVESATIIGGRYRVLRKLGRGGMGEVFLATDETLAREVAVKIAREAAGARERVRALAEARAIAQVVHPNVVEVYEVGTHAGRPFIAMEYVQGQSAETWAAAPHDVEEILTVYRQAAAGLAAAHAAGLVHRDFKPANVLVGSDGRVRVLDFGLARLATSTAEATAPDVLSATASSRSLAGTVGYVAPEVYAGDEPDAKADQFAFCVSLWRALHGSMPFAGSTPRAVRRATLAGVIAPASGTALPRWLGAALHRGLARDPDARHPDMRSLARALEPTTHRRARRGLAALLALVAVGSVTALAATRADPAQACVDRAPPWGPERAAQVRAGLHRSGSPLAAAAAARSTAALDGWAAAWISTRHQACTALADGVAVDRTLACLDRASSQLRATVAVLEAPTLEAVARLDDLLEELRPPVECMSADEPATATPSDAHIHADLDRVHALLAVGSAKAARVLALTLVERARSSPDPGTYAEALYAAGRATHRSDQRSDALDLYIRAHEIAVGARRERLAASAARAVLPLVGAIDGDQDRVEFWLRAAAAAHRRAGSDPDDAWEFLEAKGRAFHFVGRRAEARRALARARDLQREEGAGTLQRLRLLNMWAYVEARRAPEEARRLYEGALADAERLGDHPLVADVHLHFSECLSRLELNDPAVAHARLAVAMRARIFGEAAGPVGVALRFLAAAQQDRGDLDGAIASGRRSVEIARARRPPDPRAEARALGTLGKTLVHGGALAEATASLESAASMFTGLGDFENAVAARTDITSALRKQGRDAEAADQLDLAIAAAEQHPSVERLSIAALYANRATVRAKLGQFEDAHTDLDRAQRTVEAVYGTERPIHARLAASRAGIFFRALQTGEAIRWYRRSLEIAERTGGSASDVMALTRASLARALLDAERPSEALEQTDRALEALSTVTGERKATRARISYSRGEALYWLGRRVEAEKLVAAALHELEAAGEDPDMVAQMREWLAHPGERRR